METEWELWARQRSWMFHAGWPMVLARFSGGGLRKGVMREVPMAFEGRFGEYACFGFRATGGTDPWGGFDVVALRIPGAQFPSLSVAPVLGTLDGTPVPVSREFDLEWQAVSPSAAFARDVLIPDVTRHLHRIEFECLWFEQDAILVSTRRQIPTEDLDDYLTILHRIVDAIPTKVLTAVGVRRALPMRPPAPARAPAVARHWFQSGTTAEAWKAWAAERRWMVTTAKDIHERLKHRIPVAAEGHGFVGKFGDLPVFGFTAAPLRNVVGVRLPGLTLPEITIHKDDEVLAELMGGGDFEVGDPAFDHAWRIKTADEAGARRVLSPRVRARFDEAPPFDRLWFGGDSIALITTRAIAPGAVDGILTWLLSVASQLPVPGE